MRKIGILEVCAPTHYSVINGLIKAYAYDDKNLIYVFIIESIAKALQENGLPENARLIVYHENDDLNSYLKSVESYKLDRFHLCTVSKYYAKFLKFNPQCRELYFHVHNVEDWFNDNVRQRFNLMLHDLKNSSVKISPVRAMYRFVKEKIRKPYRKKILKKVYSYNHHFIVHSRGVKKFLATFVPVDKVTVFPFAIYENMDDNSVGNSKLRICVPGIVSNMRRDYDNLFRVLLENAEKLKGKIVVDLLGYIAKDELHFVDTIKLLQSKGIDMIYYLEFVSGKKYDQPLSQSDIILGNLRVEKNTSQKYGQTKESGTVYNMVRGSKPGILPEDYPLDDEFHSSTVLFKDYDHLGEIILQLVEDPSKIAFLKEKARANSEQFSPGSLYQLLMAEEVKA